MRRKLFVLLALALTAAMLYPGLADAKKRRKKLPLTTVACGDLIDKSIRVANTPAACAGHGLVVNKSGITIDLNGQTLTGDDDGADHGIHIDNFDKVTIKNGIIKRFGDGVLIDNADEGVLTGLTLIGNGTGAYLDGVANTLTKSRSIGNTDGIEIEGDNATVSKNLFSANSANIHTFTSVNGGAITRNSVVGGETSGISLNGAGMSVTRNIVDGNGDANTQPGITLGPASTGNNLSRNTVSGSGNDGIQDNGTSNTLTKNTAFGNGFGGAPSGGGTGIDASGATMPIGSKNRSFGNDAAVNCVPASHCQ